MHNVGAVLEIEHAEGMANEVLRLGDRLGQVGCDEMRLTWH